MSVTGETNWWPEEQGHGQDIGFRDKVQIVIYITDILIHQLGGVHFSEIHLMSSSLKKLNKSNKI